MLIYTEAIQGFYWLSTSLKVVKPGFNDSILKIRGLHFIKRKYQAASLNLGIGRNSKN